MKVKVEAQQDHLERLTKRSPLTAVTELIWNSVDGDATLVEVHLERNEVDGVEAVHVVDNGTGIPRSLALTAFKNLGASWKRGQTSDGGRRLHGQDGEGRFSAFSIGSRVRWISHWSDGQETRRFEIRGNINELKVFDVGDPEPIDEGKTGTEVIITGISTPPKGLAGEAPLNKLAESFALYLRQYPTVHIQYDGEHVNPVSAEEYSADYELGDIPVTDGRVIEASLTVIEWRRPVERELVLCDGGGFALGTTSVGVQAKGHNFTAYVRSDFLRELHNENRLLLSEVDPDLRAVLDASRREIKAHFLRRDADLAKGAVAQWKAEEVYPYKGEPKNLVEKVERQVFDIMALSIQDNLPKFAESDSKSKRFSLHMLKTGIEQSPSEVRRIIQEVLDLPRDKQEELIELLDKTSLAAVVSAAKLVVDRLDFVSGLEAILFQPAAKKALKERTQLHRILAENTWLFGEEYHLTVDDKGLTEVLRRHLDLLGEDRKELAPVTTLEGTQGIVDLMLSRRVPQSRPQDVEHLVIELKRPAIKIDEGVVGQLKKYARAVATDDRFNHTNTKWTFIAVSNQFGDDVESEYFAQQDRPDGLVMNNTSPSITMWVMTWGQLINACRSRLQFVQEKLGYMADEAAGMGHLNELYAKYLPDEVRQITEDDLGDAP